VPVIFENPAGAPELACDACGCRWFDRMRGTCYECGVEVSPQAQEDYQRALQAFAARRCEQRAPDPDAMPEVTARSARGAAQ
jgi:hypothetical protein